jgi:pyoverdine/dityrosine biosynthesis protein Dit1
MDYVFRLYKGLERLMEDLGVVQSHEHSKRRRRRDVTGLANWAVKSSDVNTKVSMHVLVLIVILFYFAFFA